MNMCKHPPKPNYDDDDDNVCGDGPKLAVMMPNYRSLGGHASCKEKDTHTHMPLFFFIVRIAAI